MTHLQQRSGNRTSVATDGAGIVRDHAAFVELDRRLSLFPFCVQVGQESFQHFDAHLSTQLHDEQRPMFLRVLQMAGRVATHRQTERVAENANRPRISHLDAHTENIGRRSSAVGCGGGPFDGDAPFTVEQASAVGHRHVTRSVCAIHDLRIHEHQELPHKKSANSVDTRPGQAEGNTEPSIVRKNEGVCREHVRTPKGMMCSDLRSNTQRAAEMPVPSARAPRVTSLQDAKTAHILWLGALGVSNRRKQGVGGGIDETIAA